MRNFIEEYVNSGYQLKHVLYGINYYVLRHVLVSETCRLNTGLKLNDVVENMCAQIGTECVLLGTSLEEYNKKERIYDPDDQELFDLTSEQCWTTAGYEFIELLGKMCVRKGILTLNSMERMMLVISFLMKKSPMRQMQLTKVWQRA